MAESIAVFDARILIVDDRLPNVVLLERLLQNAGYHNLHSTTDPFVVCDLHRQHHFDLILLDLQMPGMDGFTLMAALQTIDAPGYAPILAITVEPLHRLRALRSGAKDFICKPFDRVELITRIYNMVEVRLLYKMQEKTARAMERVALHDELTGLPNRRLMLDRLRQARLASERSGQFDALMFLDLDNFKQLNDTRGHGVGDLLLQQVATRLQACLREVDSVARFGGDEFVVLLAELSSQAPEATAQATGVALKIQQALQQPYSLQGMAHQCSASIGVLMFSGNTPAQDELLKQADRAMYQSKAAGRNRVTFFDPAMLATPISRAAPSASTQAADPAPGRTEPLA
jgi:diguanylate cyclase (GGDEF)-like protein